MGEEKSLENPQIPKKKLLSLKDLENPNFRGGGGIPRVETMNYINMSVSTRPTWKIGMACLKFGRKSVDAVTLSIKNR